MQQSILNSVKKLRGIEFDYSHFDADMITEINMALSVLTQIGVGNSAGFVVTGPLQKWEDFVQKDDKVLLSFVKTYVQKKVQLAFDPPSSSTVMEAINKLLSELQFRIYVQVHNIGEVSIDAE